MHPSSTTSSSSSACLSSRANWRLPKAPFGCGLVAANFRVCGSHRGCACIAAQTSRRSARCERRRRRGNETAMPSAPWRPCSGPGCRALVNTPGRCAECRRRDNQRQGSSTSRGYDRRWRTRRALFLTRYPFCGDRPGGQTPVMSKCFDEQIVTCATHVDHVVPHRGDRNLFDDWHGNYQALCARCSGRKSQAGL